MVSWFSDICFADSQFTSHVVNDCPVNEFEGGLAALLDISQFARELESLSPNCT